MTRSKRAARTGAGPLLWRIGDGAPPAAPHIAVAPGAEAPLLPLTLPDRLRGIARDRVARRMLAEQLAVPLDGLEVRPFARSGAAWSRAVVADAARLAEWRAKLGDACRALVPDFAALPCAPDVWTIEVAGDQVRARLGPEDGFTAEPAIAALMLRDAAAAARPRAILRLGDPQEETDAQIAATGAPVYADIAALAGAGHPRPLRWTEAVAGIDLKAPPSAGFDRLRRQLRGWAAPALVALSAFAVWLAGIALETGTLRESAAASRADAEAMARAHFVPAGPILDLRAQVAAALDEMRAAAPAPQTGPLVLFQTAAPHFTDPSVALQILSFRADTGFDSGLVAAVELDDFAALERLVADLRGAGFLVEELDSGARQAGGVAARLRLTQAGQ